MRKAIITILGVLILSMTAVAQTATVGAGAQISGSPATGNCAKWVSPSALGDAGSACGGGSSSGPLYVQTSVAAGDTISSSCTGTGCNFASGTYTWAAGTFCPSVGTVYHLHNAGLLSTTATAGNAGAEIELGSTVISSQQIYENANLTNVPWSGDTWITCVATGTSGAIEVDYASAVQTATSSNNGATVVDNPPNTATFSVNTTGTVTITAFAHFTGSGSVTERQMLVFKF